MNDQTETGATVPRKRIAIITTGGTIEKTYSEMEQMLHNEYSVLDVMLASLVLDGLDLVRVPLMSKDSLHMQEADHTLIARTADAMAEAHDGVIIVHGTDRLADTGERIFALTENLKVPIVLTGAMRPYELRNTDAMQNIVEALLAVQILKPGVYCVMHNTVLEFPGVRKDRQRRRFVPVDKA